MPAWIYFLHPPRENFAATMTNDEVAAWNRHFEWLASLLAEDRLVLAGPTGGPINTGIAIFEAADEESARRTVSNDPAAQGGYARGELRPFGLGLLRGRDGQQSSRDNAMETTAILMIEYRLPTGAVPDYTTWKQVFDTDPVGRHTHGATRHWIHQDHHDPNHFMLSIEFPTTDAAEAFLNEPMLRQSWQISGAGQAWILRPAEPFTYSRGQ
jgi:uncharacterized protein YciI